jgi:hypothetical protein
MPFSTMQFFFAIVIAFAVGFYTAQHVEVKVALKGDVTDLDFADFGDSRYSTRKVE